MSKIITFYSYKGGVGRSMCLANVAWILAGNGKRVLTIDWDFEAPGLHQYFRPFLIDKELSSTEGLIEFFIRYATEAMTPAENTADSQWYLAHANILRYAVSLDYQFPEGGYIDFVSAGRMNSSYASKISGFHWQNFYDRLGGGAFIEAAKEKMRSEYDYILIDSRTGVTDIAGICAVQMPDALVVCFTLNWQSVEGSSSVIDAVQSQRAAQELTIFPVAMRVENAERESLQKVRGVARQKLESTLAWMSESERQEYWDKVEFRYVPYYAYTETLAVFADQPGQPLSLMSAAENLTAYLTDQTVTRAAPLSDESRARILAKYSR